ncbi:hypothetical protein [Hyunsoonleella rubra]|uniref:Uncharacterized protein n=1 Tax=Hyunsoonleella rubra TaxID=1737062 RepID=A0ABW5T8A2_9FLAO
MEAIYTYQSFNRDKSIDELYYNTLREENYLENLKFELQFIKNLLDRPIFKVRTMNLYEKLAVFKNEINAVNKISNSLLDELNANAGKIKRKIEFEDVDYDDAFKSEYDDIELKVFNLKTKIFNLKFRLFQYLEGVIIN